MTINWKLPVETTETPPRPVRVLATDFKAKGFPYLCAVDYGGHEAHALFSAEGWDTQRVASLRNVPAKPVLHEFWLNLFRDGAEAMYDTKEEADAAMDDMGDRRVECRRIAWNSDGSPVEEKSGALFTYEDVKQAFSDRDRWRSKAEALQAEVDALADAVRAYQNAEPATSDSHEAVVDDTYQSYIPAKNCRTCRWENAQSVCGERDCLGMSQNWRGWEPKHD